MNVFFPPFLFNKIYSFCYSFLIGYLLVLSLLTSFLLYSIFYSFILLFPPNVLNWVIIFTHFFLSFKAGFSCGSCCNYMQCCCSVAESCPILYDPVDCSTQAPVSFTISQSLLKLMSVESVMPSNRLILCCPLLLLPSSFPSICLQSFPASGLFHWVSSLHQVAKVLYSISPDIYLYITFLGKVLRDLPLNKVCWF